MYGYTLLVFKTIKSAQNTTRVTSIVFMEEECGLKEVRVFKS